MSIGSALRLALGVAAWALAAAAPALDFRSVAPASAVLYDAPSSKGKRLYTVNRHYPVEVVVTLEGWSKVRDVTGELAWIEARNLAPRRTVVVTAAVAQVRQAPQPQAKLVFEAKREVVLELAEEKGAARQNGWVKVRHQDGATGYIQMSQVWGL